MTGMSRRDTLATMGLALLAGCGGGSSGGGAPPTGGSLTPAPPPTPTPSPTPPPSSNPPVGSFGSLGATASQNFATLGNSQRGKGSGWDFIADPGTFTLQPGHTFRLSAPSSLVLSVPGLGEGTLVAVNNEGNFIEGQRTSAAFAALGGRIWIYRPVLKGRLLDYSMEANFSSAHLADNATANILLEFAYGTATPSGAVPAAGTATYELTDWDDRSLIVDFDARRVTGTLFGFIQNGQKDFELRDVTLSADRSQFQGLLAAADGTTGSIEGRFTGPTGEELIGQAVMTSPTYPSIFQGRRKA